MVLEEGLDQFARLQLAFNRSTTTSEGQQLLNQILRLKRRLLGGGQFRNALGVSAQAHLSQ